MNEVPIRASLLSSKVVCPDGNSWSVGDLVIWDNTGTMHRATPYDPASGRLLHRTKLEGEEAFH